MAYFYQENRQDIPLAKISPTMQKAILAIEDDRFYEHGALDLKGTLRALVNNALRGPDPGRLVDHAAAGQADPGLAGDAPRSSGSAATEQSMARKIRELKLATEYEKTHTKDEILERYLNIAYFGDSAYGINAAAHHWFSRRPAKLNVRQAATARRPGQEPVDYDPKRLPEKALAATQHRARR